MRRSRPGASAVRERAASSVLCWGAHDRPSPVPTATARRVGSPRSRVAGGGADGAPGPGGVDRRHAGSRRWGALGARCDRDPGGRDPGRRHAALRQSTRSRSGPPASPTSSPARPASASRTGAARFYDTGLRCPSARAVLQGHRPSASSRPDTRPRASAATRPGACPSRSSLSSRARPEDRRLHHRQRHGSRDIEGENPLYLPQAKVYDRRARSARALPSRTPCPPREQVAIRLTIDAPRREPSSSTASTSPGRDRTAPSRTW